MVEKISADEFIRRTMGGRPCALQVGIYYDCTYECGCGKTHTFTSRTQILREVPMLKLVLKDPDCEYITFIKIRGLFKYRFESLFSASE